MFMWWRAPVQAARVFPLVTCPKNMDKIRELLGLLLFVFVCWGGNFGNCSVPLLGSSVKLKMWVGADVALHKLIHADERACLGTI